MNTAASVRARLLNASKQSGEDFQSVLVRYVIERFLYRLGKSQHCDAFLLKGAMLFVLWRGNPHRPTKDLDLLGFGDPTPEQVAKRIADIAGVPCDDGVVFDSGTIEIERIKEDADYEAVRIRLLARLEQAKVRIQIDVGFGDAVMMAPSLSTFPTIIDRVATPVLRVYPPEAVVAEKLQAMVVLDIRNSRMKDFFDLWVLARTRAFQLVPLSAAIRATFDRRNTLVPDRIPFALTDSFLLDAGKVQQWTGFVKRLRLDPAMPSLAVVGNEIARFLDPVFTQTPGERTWPPGGPWA
ncbi:MAG: nucleotidyl transferase AbiEii/AbiGii toxin family protein [Acidobacteria bacterium]|nr:nucleotidyl transferase AbiEii/AbiGii toxin family protein [Acidobacteriota bacterium]